ncbi:unnamed protein product [Closterium sp. NIES-64]|nr:unnamed protein product [Closterium sp. NIES-64]
MAEDAVDRQLALVVEIEEAGRAAKVQLENCLLLSDRLGILRPLLKVSRRSSDRVELYPSILPLPTAKVQLENCLLLSDRLGILRPLLKDMRPWLAAVQMGRQQVAIDAILLRLERCARLPSLAETSERALAALVPDRDISGDAENTTAGFAALASLSLADCLADLAAQAASTLPEAAKQARAIQAEIQQLRFVPAGKQGQAQLATVCGQATEQQRLLQQLRASVSSLLSQLRHSQGASCRGNCSGGTCSGDCRGSSRNGDGRSMGGRGNAGWEKVRGVVLREGSREQVEGELVRVLQQVEREAVVVGVLKALCFKCGWMEETVVKKLIRDLGEQRRVVGTQRWAVDEIQQWLRRQDLSAADTCSDSLSGVLSISEGGGVGDGEEESVGWMRGEGLSGGVGGRGTGRGMERGEEGKGRGREGKEGRAEREILEACEAMKGAGDEVASWDLRLGRRAAELARDVVRSLRLRMADHQKALQVGVGRAACGEGRDMWAIGVSCVEEPWLALLAEELAAHRDDLREVAAHVTAVDAALSRAAYNEAQEAGTVEGNAACGGAGGEGGMNGAGARGSDRWARGEGSEGEEGMGRGAVGVAERYGELHEWQRALRDLSIHVRGVRRQANTMQRLLLTVEAASAAAAAAAAAGAASGAAASSGNSAMSGTGASGSRTPGRGGRGRGESDVGPLLARMDSDLRQYVAELVGHAGVAGGVLSVLEEDLDEAERRGEEAENKGGEAGEKGEAQRRGKAERGEKEEGRRKEIEGRGVGKRTECGTAGKRGKENAREAGTRDKGEFRGTGAAEVLRENGQARVGPSAISREERGRDDVADVADMGGVGDVRDGAMELAGQRHGDGVGTSSVRGMAQGGMTDGGKGAAGEVEQGSSGDEGFNPRRAYSGEVHLSAEQGGGEKLAPGGAVRGEGVGGGGTGDGAGRGDAREGEGEGAGDGVGRGAGCGVGAVGFEGCVRAGERGGGGEVEEAMGEGEAALAALVSALWYGSEEDQEAAAEAVLEGCDTGAITATLSLAARILAGKWQPALAAALKPLSSRRPPVVQSAVATSLVCLAVSDELRTALASQGLLQALLLQVRKPHRLILSRCVFALGQLARCDSVRCHVTDSGSMSFLVPLLRSKDVEVRESAALLFKNMVFRDPPQDSQSLLATRACVVKHGAVPLLLSALSIPTALHPADTASLDTSSHTTGTSSTSAEAHESAAEAAAAAAAAAARACMSGETEEYMLGIIGGLAQSPRPAVPLPTRKLIACIIPHLAHPSTPTVRIYALAALAALAKVDPEGDYNGGGSVEGAVRRVGGVEREERAEGGVVAVVELEGLVPVLQVVRDTAVGERVRLHAVSVLCAIAGLKSRDYRSLIALEGGLPPLVALLSPAFPLDLRLLSATTLRLLSLSPVVRRSILLTGALLPLVDLLREQLPNPFTNVSVAAAVAALVPRGEEEMSARGPVGLCAPVEEQLVLVGAVPLLVAVLLGAGGGGGEDMVGGGGGMGEEGAANEGEVRRALKRVGEVSRRGAEEIVACGGTRMLDMLLSR